MVNMLKDKKWLAFFSQTGSEIARLSEYFDKWPNKIITDQNDILQWDGRIDANKNVSVVDIRSLHKQERNDKYRELLKGYDIITLHGWLNIIPPEICKEFKLYNGHPGYINLYPELKGKDPQIKAWENISKYEWVGSVVHEVTAEVDEGEIICAAHEPSSVCMSLDDTYQILKQTSFQAWITFFSLL